MRYSKSKIRNFYNYDLPEDELVFIENNINDKTMNQSLDHYKLSEQLSSELYAPGYIELLKQKRESILSQLPTIQKKKSINRIKSLYLGIAASISLLLCSVFLFQQNSNSIDSRSLIKQSSESALNLDYLSSIERSDVNNTNQLVKLYKEENYSSLIIMLKTKQRSDIESLILAKAYIKENNYSQAKAEIQNINSENFPQKDALIWTKAEIAFHFDNKIELNNFLTIIITNKYPNHKNASKILDTL